MTASYIYFVQAHGDGPIKIGTTADDPRKRMVKIQSDCPWPISLIGAIHGTVSQEKQIHLVLAPWRTQGEWFEPHCIVLAAIREALSCGKSIVVPRRQKVAKYDHPLCRYRIERKLTLRDLADETGISFAALARYESGARLPDVKSLKILERVTGIPAKQLRPDLADLLGAA